MTAFDEAAELMNFPAVEYHDDAREAFAMFDPAHALKNGGDTVLDRAWIRIAGMIGEKARARDEHGVVPRKLRREKAFPSRYEPAARDLADFIPGLRGPGYRGAP